MKGNRFFVEVDAFLKKKEGQPVCGDCFVSRKVQNEHRIVATLSDGLGSGVKANVLATMTASMAVNFISRHEPIERTAKAIMRTLPIDSKRMMSYATFTIIDVRHDGETRVVEYGNPKCAVVRNGELFQPHRNEMELDTDKADKIMYSFEFKAQKEDRLVFFSDGVSQAGIGTNYNPFGWEEDQVHQYICDVIADNKYISAGQLAKKIVRQAVSKDILKPKDDTSCGVIYFREPRKLLICTGPPFHKRDDERLAGTINGFDGRKIVCGGTTAQILARELKREIEVGMMAKGGLPPTSKMDGVDLITEGILTLGGVASYLENNANTSVKGEGPAVDIVRMLFDSDEIHFMVGTKINEAHQDPNLPVELEIRRNVIKKIKRLLEDKFLKEVKLEFI
ncbi:stage II sporulation protein E [Prolixibacteraceae bacterium JC049]|nr:stage II sporulation protein E [Prolixibacteraceae bacterium JC049]